MVEFLLVIEFLTFVRCIKSEFERANELLRDVSVLSISSIASELFDHREEDGSFSIERSLPINSKKLFIVAPSLRERQTQLQISSHKINRSRMLLRTIRQIHLELCRVSKSFKEEIHNTHELILQLIRTLLLCLQHSTKIFVVNYLCDKTTKEAEQTNEIIHTFYGQNTDFEIQKEVEIFSLQMKQRRNCIGIITTYMVIMIQVTDSIKAGS
ncbi:putative gustatory receptor 28b [Vespula squamosa]|uniref:Gustatory receptor 28b n=1 Tax=Vespula squamosa TaxID=30214 RepID=A0ABD2AYN3_VESSQ